MPECCVSDCKSGRKKTAKNPEPEKVQMFLLPTETTARNRWLIQCGIGKNLSQSARICAKHFLKSCFLSPSENVDDHGRPRARLRLKDDAVPTEFRFGPSPISYKRKIINSETAEDINLEVKPNILKKPVKSEFNEHGYCYDNTSDKGNLLKFIYSEKATKFCEIFPLLLSYAVLVKRKGRILQNFVAFSEYMNFKGYCHSSLC